MATTQAKQRSTRTGGSVTSAQIEEIAKVKLPDLNANDLDAAKKIVEGTARSMGISVS